MKKKEKKTNTVLVLMKSRVHRQATVVTCFTVPMFGPQPYCGVQPSLCFLEASSLPTPHYIASSLPPKQLLKAN